MTKGLIPLNNAEELERFLEQPTKAIAETLTGILGSGTHSLILSVGKVVQASLEGKMLKQLGKELADYKEKGRIKEDYFATSKNQATFYELLKFIDEEVPEEERFKAMKSIFLSAVSKNATEEDEALAYELMQICKQLSSGEVVLLKAAYDIANNRLAPGVSSSTADSSASYWLKNLAKQIGHEDTSLIELHEEKLIKLKLISERRFSDQSGIVSTQTNRLTPLGIKLCEFITKYD